MHYHVLFDVVVMSGVSLAVLPWHSWDTTWTLFKFICPHFSDCASGMWL